MQKNFINSSTEKGNFFNNNIEGRLKYILGSLKKSNYDLIRYIEVCNNVLVDNYTNSLQKDLAPSEKFLKEEK